MEPTPIIKRMIDYKPPWETSIPSIAYILASNGFRVFPLRPNTKIPLIKEWQKLATNKLETVRSWWKHNPRANIGIATGDGLVVVDLDTPDHKGGMGPDGLASWMDFYVTCLDDLDTLEVTTPTGGKHLYFYTEKIYKNATGVLPGVDVRGQGGYVVAHGSFINGIPYRLTCKKGDIKPVGEGLDRLLTGKYTPILSPRITDFQKPGASNTLIPKGERTDYLVRQCASLCDGSKSIEAMENMIRDLNQVQLEEPLSEDELRREVFPALSRFEAHTPKSIDTEELTLAKGVNLVSMAELKMKKVDWLINGYIPKGCITVLGGDGGNGKTSLWCNLVGSITSGKSNILDDSSPLPNPGIAIVLSGEDDPESVLKRKLIECGADESNVYTLKLDDESLHEITIGGPILEKLVAGYRPLIVVLDPIQQFLKDLDMSKRNDIRRTLQSLAVLGKKYGTSFLLVVHTNKRDKVSSFRDKLSDSADIWDIARSVLAIGKTSDGLHFISQEKSSYGRLKDTITFTFKGSVIEKIGTDSRHFTELMTGRAPGKELQRKDCQDLMLATIEHNPGIKKSDLVDSLNVYGYTLNMINQVYKSLQESEKIETKKHAEGYGNGVQTCLYLKENIENEN